jgi:hypothetical protein
MAQDDKRAIAAIFETRDDARQAIKQLHKQHYTHTWFGMTSVAEKDGGKETVAIDKPGFFSSNAQNLAEALEKHGVPPQTARALETAITPGQAVLTVEPREQATSEAAAILESTGGELADEAIARAGQDAAARRRRRVEAFGEDIAGDDLPVDYVEEIFYFTTIR